MQWKEPRFGSQSVFTFVLSNLAVSTILVIHSSDTLRLENMAC